MNRIQQLCLAAIAAVAVVVASRAEATVVDFDALAETPNGIPIPNAYAGFSWNNFYELDGLTAGGSGYLPGTVSLRNVAFNWFANPASLNLANGRQFNFSGAYLTGAWNDGLQVEVQGFRDHVLIYDRTVSPSATSPTFFTFNFQNVDTLSFNSFGGPAVAGLLSIGPSDNNAEFWIDQTRPTPDGNHDFQKWGMSFTVPAGQGRLNSASFYVNGDSATSYSITLSKWSPTLMARGLSALLILVIAQAAGGASAAILYVSDYGSNNIYTYTPTGSRTTFATGLDDPQGLAFDGHGNLFAGDYMSGNIYKFTSSGFRSVFASGLFPTGLAFDGSGSLFEPDDPIGQNKPIFKFSSTGIQSTFATGLSAPDGLAFDSHGDLFVADRTSFGGAIYEYSPTGTRSTFVGSGLNEPIDVAFDSSGNLYESDYNSGRILKFSATGVRSTFASGLSHPSGLAFDPSGNLFATDFGSGSIYRFTPTGTRTLFATGLTGPTHLAFAPVPEASSLILVVIGGLAVSGAAMRRRRCVPAARGFERIAGDGCR